MGFFQDLRSVQHQAEAKKAHHLGMYGRPGTATITAIRRTGTFVNDDPEVEMDLQVTVDGLSPYRTTHRQIVGTRTTPGLHPGAIVPVKVDPAEPTSLIVA